MGLDQSLYKIERQLLQPCPVLITWDDLDWYETIPKEELCYFYKIHTIRDVVKKKTNYQDLYTDDYAAVIDKDTLQKCIDKLNKEINDSLADQFQTGEDDNWWYEQYGEKYKEAIENITNIVNNTDFEKYCILYHDI